MPTPIETTIDIVLDPSSRMREITPLVYQLPKDSTKAYEPRMRYLDLSCSAANRLEIGLEKNMAILNYKYRHLTNTKTNQIFLQ